MIMPNGVQDKNLVILYPVAKVLAQEFQNFFKITKMADFEKKLDFFFENVTQVT